MRVCCLLILLFWAVPVAAQDGPSPVMDKAITGSLVAAGMLAMLEIGGTEAGIQQGSISEANRFQPDGNGANATAGRMLIKGAGTAAAVVMLDKLRERHPRWALAGSVGLAAFNGYLTARSFHYLRQGQR